MQVVDILKKWSEYTDFDPDRKEFHLGSLTYDYHRCNETIAKFMPYNPSGELAVLYAKNQFRKIMSDKRLNAFDVISELEQLRPHIDMWELFCSDDVKSIEENVLDDFNDLICKVIPSKQLGERDLAAERNAITGAVETVVEALYKCNVECFLHGGRIDRIASFSTVIHVFDRLAECLLNLESSPDGMYLCYIKNFGSVDGYFGFFLKSNGTILSVNERLKEAYPGEHRHHRNNRYAENKQYSLFPYDYIFSFDGCDYKGYATSHTIDEEQLVFFKLTPRAYLPLVIAMVLLRNRYEDFDASDLPQLYVDSLLPVNLALPMPGTEALIVPDNSTIAAINRDFAVNITTSDVLSGAYDHLINGRSGTFDEECTPETKENIFVKTYGKGFQLDPSRLLESNSHLKRLTSAQIAASTVMPDAEFVATSDRMKQIAYMNARSQLADYIRDKMFEAYLAAGGAPAIREWWEKAILTARDKVIAICLERYKNGSDGPSSVRVGSVDFEVGMDRDLESRSRFDISGAIYPFNEWPVYKTGYKDYRRPLCCITGQKASSYFLFTIKTDAQMRELLGNDNVPAILTGYKKSGHYVSGNTILSVTDPVTGIGTPFEEHEYSINRRLWTEQEWSSFYLYHPEERPNSTDPFWSFVPDTALHHRPVLEFDFIIAFSKRGLSMLLKGKS